MFRGRGEGVDYFCSDVDNQGEKTVKIQAILVGVAGGLIFMW